MGNIISKAVVQTVHHSAESGLDLLLPRKLHIVFTVRLIDQSSAFHLNFSVYDHNHQLTRQLNFSHSGDGTGRNQFPSAPLQKFFLCQPINHFLESSVKVGVSDFLRIQGEISRIHPPEDLDNVGIVNMEKQNMDYELII